MTTHRSNGFFFHHRESNISMVNIYILYNKQIKRNTKKNQIYFDIKMKANE